MSLAAICRIVGGVLVVIVAAAIGAGGFQLWRGGPAAWPDITANETTVRRTSAGMIVMAALLLMAGIAAIGNMSWGGHLAAVGIIGVVVAAFGVNYALFGAMRAWHTGTNVVVATIILALLWFGNAGQDR